MDPDLKLEHCLLKWKIENFNCWSHGSGQELISPHFQLDAASLTKWELILLPNLDGPSEVIKFRLHRCPLDDGPDEVFVNFRFLLKDSLGTMIWPLDSVNYVTFGEPFEKDSHFVIETIPLDIVLDNLPMSLESRFLVILLDMFILREDDTLGDGEDCFITPQNPEYRQLSYDLEQLFYSTRNADFTMFTANGNIRTHKAVLSIRADGLKFELVTDGLTMPLISKEAVNILLLHVYSGQYELDVGHAMYLPLLSELAIAWDVYPLKNWLAANKVCFRSDIDCERGMFIWEITDYSLYEEHCKEIKSPVFTTGHQNPEEWVLRLLPKGSDDQIIVEVHVNNLNRKVLASIKLEIGKDRGELLRWIEADATMRFDSLEKRSVSESVKDNLGNDDVLLLRCSVTLSSTAEYRTYKETSTCFAETPNPEGNSLRVLSDDFQNYTKAKFFADSSLICGETRFDVHKSILCARSSFFTRLYEEGVLPAKNPPFSMPFVNDDPFVLEKLILFLYSGKLENLTPTRALKLALAAGKLSIDKVLQRCSVYLKSHLNPQLVFDVLTLASSIEHYELRHAVFKYIKRNAQDVFATEEWRHYKNNSPQMAEKILELVTKP